MARPEVVLYIASTVDGFIADEEGGVEWLSAFDARDYGYDEFIKRIDAILMGRVSAEQAIGFGWAYGGKRTVVLCSRRPEGLPPEVETYSGDPGALLERLGAEGHERVWLIGGAETARRFMDAGLIDEIDMTVIPVVLRRGVPIFLPGAAVDLRLLSSEALSRGVVRLRYAPA